MKILLVSNYGPDRQYSMLGFAACLERELVSLGCQVTRIAPKPFFGLTARRPGVRKWLAYFDKYVLFPAALRRASARHDLTHILDQGNSMYVPHIASRPHVVTCHDILAIRAAIGEIPGWEVSPTGCKYQAMILKGLNRAKMIAVDSRATGEDLERLTGRTSDLMKLIYIGQVQEMPAVSEADAHRLLADHSLKRPYLLHVGNSSPYKNRKGLLAIFGQLVHQLGDQCPNLVMAGSDPNEEVRAAFNALPPNKVRAIVEPSFELLSALYRKAEALVFPSLYEGFGLPILEAQSLGCPVFTTDRRPMTEVGGSAAKYFDPSDPAGAARVIATGLNEPDAMRAKGIENASKFTAAGMATDYLHLYQELLGGGTSGNLIAENTS